MLREQQQVSTYLYPLNAGWARGTNFTFDSLNKQHNRQRHQQRHPLNCSDTLPPPTRVTAHRLLFIFIMVVFMLRLWFVYGKVKSAFCFILHYKGSFLNSRSPRGEWGILERCNKRSFTRFLRYLLLVMTLVLLFFVLFSFIWLHLPSGLLVPSTLSNPLLRYHPKE